MKTISREHCSACGKKNLCTYPNSDNSVILQQCRTDGCLNNEVKTLEQTGNTQTPRLEKPQTMTLLFQPIQEAYRGLTPETCAFVGIDGALLYQNKVIRYKHSSSSGQFSYKYRWPSSIGEAKKFSWNPELPNTDMFNLMNCTEFDKPLIITEGNEDCASLVQLGYQAASLFSGDTAEKNLLINKTYLEKFNEIWLCIENDSVGLKARELLKRELSNKLLKEVDLTPYKDANEMLQASPILLRERLISPIEVVPRGIIFGNQINSDKLREPLPPGLKVPYPKLQEITKGILPGNLWVLCAGVSIGKSSVMRDFSVYCKKQGYKVANIFVEEDAKVSQLNYIATELGYPIGAVLQDPSIIEKTKWDEAFDRLLNDNDLMFIDENWEQSNDNLLSTIRYLASVKKYDIILLDHLTALVNFSKVGKAGKVHDIDYLMEQLFQVARQTGTRILLVSHLKRVNESPNWDEGRKPTMYDLRGSASLEGKPDVIIGLSRNMKNEIIQDKLYLEVLKNRWFAKLGMADELFYINETGRLVL